MGGDEMATRRRHGWPVRYPTPRRYRRLVYLTALASAGLVVLSIPATAQTTTTTTPAVPVNNNPGLDLTGGSAILFAGIFIVVLAVLWFIPVYLNTRAANRMGDYQQKAVEKLLGAGPGDEATPEQRTAFMKSLSDLTANQATLIQQTSPNNQGLTSSLLALLTLSLVGFALAVVLISKSSDAGDLRKTIIASLVSILATISGFYFGARTAQVSAQQANQAGPNPNPDPNRPNPDPNHPNPNPNPPPPQPPPPPPLPPAAL